MVTRSTDVAAPAILESMPGGVTAAAGFRAAGVACGIKLGGLDLALVAAEQPASAAGVFTTNLVTAAPVLVSREHLRRTSGVAQAVVANSGCANACTGDAGLAAARAMADATAQALDCRAEHVLVASTGVIGISLDVRKVKAGIATATEQLDRGGHSTAAEAIMTTDLAPKETAIRVVTPDGVFHVGGMAKGAGMIDPRMATMLGFLTTDAAVAPELLQRALSEAADDTFNAITVDGDTSTNDSVFAFASGRSGVTIDEARFGGFLDALRAVCHELALAIVRNGEGATKLVAVRVVGADSREDARRAAHTIANSLLVKTAIHGGDPNWGRIVAAAGRSGAAVTAERARVRIGQTVVFDDGQPFDERGPTAAAYLRGREVEIEIDLGRAGEGQATIWTCDLSADYVRINADYRT